MGQAQFRDLGVALAELIEADNSTYTAGGAVQFQSAVIDVSALKARKWPRAYNSIGLVLGGKMTLAAAETGQLTVTIQMADNVGMTNPTTVKTQAFDEHTGAGTFDISGALAMGTDQLGEDQTHVQFTVDAAFSAGTVDNWAAEISVAYGYADQSHHRT